MNAHIANVKPTTFEELKSRDRPPEKKCSRCQQKLATHSVSMTVVELGKGRGGMVAQVRKIPTCEPCSVELFGAVKRGLRQ